MKSNAFLQIILSRLNKLNDWIRKWIPLIQVIGVIAVIINVGIAYHNLSTGILNVGTIASSTQEVANLTQEAVKKLAEANQFRITYPVNGGAVELTDIVRGTTPYSNRNHYIIVTPIGYCQFKEIHLNILSAI